MNINVTKSEQINVKINNDEIIKIVSDVIYKSFNWEPDFVIRSQKNKLYIFREWDCSRGHYDWTEKVLIREATLEDINNYEHMMNVLTRVHKKYKG